MSVVASNSAAPSLPLAEPVAPALPLRLHTPHKMRLVVIVPALNEEKTIGDVIRAIPAQIPGIDDICVVVVNDGSTDRTAELARAAGAQVVSHPRPSGVGSAFQSGLRRALQLGADFIANIDGDGQFNPADLPTLLAPVVAGEADFATASRFADPALLPQMPAIKIWGNRQVSRLICYLTGLNIRDCTCGMRVYNREAALSLSVCERFTYTHEVLLHLAAKRMGVVEVPLRIRGEREFGKSRVASNLFRYGSQTLKIIFRFYRDYSPVKFFGTIALGSLALMAPLVIFLMRHYWLTGAFTPHKWAAFAAGGLAGLAGVAVFMAILGDMLHRQRHHLEEIVYHCRAMNAWDER